MTNTIEKDYVKTFNKLRWSLISLFFIATIFMVFTNVAVVNTLKPVIITIFIFIIVILHGIERYGIKKMVIFFLITWVVSNFFEALSIQTGFPFGFYQYVDMPGPRIFEVPLLIMFAYFAMGYISWMISHVLTGQYLKKLEGKQIFIVPLIASFIMVMWDLCIDPLSSTLVPLWIWKSPGAYFGVPITNYFGWFLVTFIFFQIFALYLSKYDRIENQEITILSSKTFWIEVITVYGIQAMYLILNPFSLTNPDDIVVSMALIAVFTMLFVTIISLITVTNNRDLNW